MDEIIKELNKWHEQENRLNILNEEYKALKEKLDIIGKESLDIQKNKYKYTDAIISKHKYWTNSDSSIIIKVGTLHPKGMMGTEFFVSKKGDKDKKYFSSSLGILYHGDVPIMKERYDELYNAM